MKQTHSSPVRRIKVGELQVGIPLPFDVFDSNNRLLLRRGYRISTESQLERLVHQGIFHGEAGKDGAASSDDAFAAMPSSDFQSAPALEVSTFRMLDDCALSLDGLLHARSVESGLGHFADQVELLAERIQRVCRSDNDAALAYVLLGQAPHYIVRQQINVAILSALMLSRLSLESVRAETAIAAALTMNISMLDLQEELYFGDQPLDETRRATIRQHPLTGSRALRELGVGDPGWLEIVEQHHEAFDGFGYPHGLRGEQICQEARVIATADRYNALVMNRAYRHGIAPDLALKELARRDARATDPALLGLLIKVIGVYPPGTVVALANKEIGVVTNRLLDLKHPVVRTFFRASDWPYDKPVKRFTGRMPQFAIVKALSRDELKFTIDPEQLWPPTRLVEPDGA